MTFSERLPSCCLNATLPLFHVSRDQQGFLPAAGACDSCRRSCILFTMMRHIDPNWEVTAQDVKVRIDAGEALVLIDVRQPEELEICGIEAAHLFPLPNLKSSIGEIAALAEGRAIITFCHHGHRSVQAAVFLREAGIGRVHSMAGGIDAWSRTVDANVPRY